MKKKLLALVAAMIMVIGLVACGAPATVEEYYTQPLIKESLDSQINAMKGDYAGIYSDLGYTVEGNTFTYWFKFAEQVEDVDAAASQLDAALTDDVFAGIVKDIETECGVTGLTGGYIYYNADGSVIFEDSYSTAQ